MKLRLVAILSLISLTVFGQEDGVTARLGSLKGNDRVVTNAAAFVTIGTVEEVIDGKMSDYVKAEDFKQAITNLNDSIYTVATNLATIVSNTVPQGVVQADIGYVVSTNGTEITTNLVYSITNKMAIASSDLEIKDGTNTVSIGDFIKDNSVEPSSMEPLMAGVARVGESNLYARADHVHPGETVVSNIVVLTTYASRISINPLTGEETTNETEVVSTTTWTNNIVYVRDVRVVPYDSVLTPGGLIKPNLVTTSAITNKAITGWKIGDQTMRDANFSTDSIQGYRLKKNSVAGAANDTSTSTAVGQIAYNTVGTVNLRDQAVTIEKLSQQVQDLMAAFTTWTNSSTIVAGWNSSAPSDLSVAIGHDATASARESIAVGWGSWGDNVGAVAVGGSANARDTYSAAFGPSAIAFTRQSLALGYYATAGLMGQYGNTENCTAVGYAASAYGEGSVQLGACVNNDSYSLHFRDITLIDSNGDLVLPSSINMGSGSIYFGSDSTSYISETYLSFSDAWMDIYNVYAIYGIHSPSFDSYEGGTTHYGALNIHPDSSNNGEVDIYIPLESSDRIVASVVGAPRLFFAGSSDGSWYKLDVNSDGDPIVVSGESPYDY